MLDICSTTMIINRHLEKSVLHAWDIWLFHRGDPRIRQTASLLSCQGRERADMNCQLHSA